MLLNLDSVKQVCGNSSEVMFYGFRKFEYYDYYDLLNALKNIHGMKIFNYENWPLNTDIWGSDTANKVSRMCKAPITDLILENYKRYKNNLPIIPLIMCVGSDSERYEWTEITDRPSPSYKRITYSELRRCYKIYSETSPEIKKIADLTFKFVILETNAQQEYCLKQINPCWAEQDWGVFWKKNRQQGAQNIFNLFQISSQGSVTKDVRWKSQLLLETENLAKDKVAWKK